MMDKTQVTERVAELLGDYATDADVAEVVDTLHQDERGCYAEAFHAWKVA